MLCLALGSALVGFAGGPVTRILASGWVMVPPGSPVMPGDINLPHMNMVVALLGTAMACVGAAGAYCATMVFPGWDWRWRGGRVEALIESDFGWKIVVGWFAAAARSSAHVIGVLFDHKLWDGFLESLPRALGTGADAIARAAQGRLNDYLWWMAAGTALLLGRVLR